MPPAGLLLLLDGTGFIFRYFYAVQYLSNRDGFPTNVVFGFYRDLLRFFRQHDPDYIGVAMDRPEPTFRHREFPDYKAKRPEPPDDLIRQIPHVRSLCEALRVPILEKVGFEADDIMATLAREAAGRGLQVILASSDKDLLQLVGGNIRVLNPVRNVLFDAGSVERTFGVPPDRVTDVLALWGDSSDNVPGVPGIGEKGAKDLVRRFGDLEAVLARASEVTRKSYREGLQKFADQARRSRSLVTLRTDVPLDIDIEALRRREPDRVRLAAFLDALDISEREFPVRNSRRRTAGVESQE